MTKNDVPKAPKHLRPPTRRWFEQLCGDYRLESFHVRLLTLACEAWDRAEAAREALAEHGVVFENRHGELRPRPEVQIAKDSTIVFARLLRQLGLDGADGPEAVDAPRLPGLPGTRGRFGGRR